MFAYKTEMNGFLNRPSILFSTKVDSSYFDGHAGIVLFRETEFKKPDLQATLLSAMQLRRMLKSNDFSATAEKGSPLLMVYGNTLRLNPFAIAEKGWSEDFD